LRPLDPAADVAEVKRLYVRPERRGEGWGRRLAQTVIDEARLIAYRELKLDTLERMTSARALYAELGFRECAPYYRNPLPGAVYMALALRGRPRRAR
jgi:putative acetyltransferase